MLTAILSAAGLGGLGLAVALIPGLGARLLALAGQALGIAMRYPWQVACLVLAGVAAWCWQGWSRADDDRARLAVWQDQVTRATREAAHHPRLGKAHVADQVRNLGLSLDRILAAQEEAKRRLLAAKREREREQDRQRRSADDALASDLAAQRRRTAAALGARGLSQPAGSPPGDRGGAAWQPGLDLPAPAFGAEKPDRPDRGSGQFVVSGAYIDACDVVTARLHNAADWAAATLPAGD